MILVGVSQNLSPFLYTTPTDRKVTQLNSIVETKEVKVKDVKIVDRWSLNYPERIENFQIQKMIYVPNMKSSKYNSSTQWDNYILQFTGMYGSDPVQLKRVMMCESSGYEFSQSYIYYGLYQFAESTFNSFKNRMGRPELDWKNPVNQIEVACWAFANGYSSHWSCK